MLEATTLSCCTSGVSSLPAFSLLLLAFLRRPAGGAVCKSPRLGGSVLPRRRYRASISRFCWLCSSEISRRCLQGEQRRAGWASGPTAHRSMAQTPAGLLGSAAAQRSWRLFLRLPVHTSTTWASRALTNLQRCSSLQAWNMAGLFVLVFFRGEKGEAGVWTPSHIHAPNTNPVHNHSD